MSVSVVPGRKLHECTTLKPFEVPIVGLGLKPILRNFLRTGYLGVSNAGLV